MKTFPVFETHEKVTCFKCGEALQDAPEETDHPEGRYRQFCEKCGHYTFYDVATLVADDAFWEKLYREKGITPKPAQKSLF